MNAPVTTMPSELRDLRQLSVTLVARELGVKPADIQCDQPWTHYGLDSLSALVVAGDLEDALAVELPSTLLWDCRTLDELALGLQRVIRGARDERDAPLQAAASGLALA